MSTLKSQSKPASLHPITNVHITDINPLPSPQALLDEFPVSSAHYDFVLKARQTIHNILTHQDPRLLLVVGPCSIHDTKAGLDYAQKLHELSKQVESKIYIVMRAYFEKPRTFTGWKGLIMDPHLDGSSDIAHGFKLARQFLSKLIDLGLPTATELLDPITPQYIADLICWTAIGARTTESQTHRQLASGLSMPVGFKNATDGSLAAAINAIRAASQPQTFLGIDQAAKASAITTLGNPNCHIVLRGGKDGPNYSADHIETVTQALAKYTLNPAIMVDCSHANSNKDPKNQPVVLKDIIKQRQSTENSQIIGAMLESNLEVGNQKFPQPKEQLKYGQSITDGCIDWATTEALILEIYKSCEGK